MGSQARGCSLDVLIGAPSIRKALKYEVRAGNIAKALEDPCEQDRYLQRRGPDGRLWIAAKKGTMSLLDRTRIISGIRGNTGAVEVTLEYVKTDSVMKKKDYLVMIPFVGAKSDASDCLDKGLRPLHDRGRMTFFLAGIERFDLGGAKAVEHSEFLFCMDIRELLRVGFEMWLDAEVKTRG